MYARETSKIDADRRQRGQRRHQQHAPTRTMAPDTRLEMPRDMIEAPCPQYSADRRTCGKHGKRKPKAQVRAQDPNAFAAFLDDIRIDMRQMKIIRKHVRGVRVEEKPCNEHAPKSQGIALPRHVKRHLDRQIGEKDVVDHRPAHVMIRGQAHAVGNIAERDATAEHGAHDPSAPCRNHVLIWNIIRFHAAYYTTSPASSGTSATLIAQGVSLQGSESPMAVHYLAVAVPARLDFGFSGCMCRFVSGGCCFEGRMRLCPIITGALRRWKALGSGPARLRRCRCAGRRTPKARPAA